MRLVLRVLGTWLLGLAVILLVIDGTRSLGANALTVSSLGAVWTALDAASLEAVREFLSTRLFSALLERALTGLLDLPGFVVVGVPGLVLALVGRRRQPDRFVRADRI